MPVKPELLPEYQKWRISRHFVGNRTPEELLRALIHAHKN